ncbi:unnamed protein product [Ostreobium quekettii]|uniref:Trafficking protein particle complex subunit 2-like protein n=1 Tax=Ostreobium quekettii TaxID=121088 RepID=A0A8S1ITE9_9CHLO|nr:unnamed protein product [Ostreobium quekettii]
MLRQLRVNCAGSFGTKSPRTETFSARVSPPSTQSRSMIVCAAVIGQANNPLYIRCFLDESSESALKFHYIVHCSLDAIEEKVLAPKRNPAELQEAYLGLLYPTEDCKVFGYVTSTHIKFVLVVDDAPFKEDDIQLIFRRFHHAYVNAVSNPFYTFGMVGSVGNLLTRFITGDAYHVRHCRGMPNIRQ